MKTKRILLIALAVILTVTLSLVVFTACNKGKNNNSDTSSDTSASEVNGTYYLYFDGKKVNSQYYKLSDGIWNSESVKGGTYVYVQSSNNITLYYKNGGLFQSGTIKNGVLTLENRGIPVYYCIDGAIPPSTSDVKPKPDDGGSTTPVIKTVTFDVNGGDRGIDPMEFEVGKSMTNLPTPTRSGYNFVVWKDFGGQTYTRTSVMPNRDLTLYAFWEKRISKYEDEYVSLKPAAEGYKSDVVRDFARANSADKCIYVEITSDDLGGVAKVGVENNFTLRTMDTMEYSLKDGYKWKWYQGDFSHPNGAQRFTLNYGSNLQLLTIENKSGIVIQTYVVDIYVKYDYYVELYENLQAQEPYDTVRVIENDRFSSDTPIRESMFEFDARVYYNGKTHTYEPWDYATAIRSDLKLYQAYKPYTVSPNLNSGSLSQEFTMVPYEQNLTLPIPQREGYDFIGWQTSDGKFLTDLNGHATIHYLSEQNYNDISAVWQPKQFYYSVEVGTNQDVHTMQTMVPVVTYTDYTFETILEILHVPQNTTCPAPTKVNNDDARVFTDWYIMDYETNTGSEFHFSNKINEPTALYAHTVTTSSKNIVHLNESQTFDANTTLKSYYGYMPVKGTYTLEVSTTGKVVFTIDAFDTTPAQKYTVTSSQTITLTNGIAAGCGFSFTVTEQTGSFTVEFSGATANESDPVVQTKDNVIEFNNNGFEMVADKKDGCTFVGWYKDGEQVSSDLQYTITMTDSDVTYTAKWSKVTLEVNDSSAGSVRELTETYEVGDEVQLVAITNPGYTFVGWYKDGEQVSSDLQYTITMTDSDVTYTAKWSKVTLTVNNSNAGSVSSLTETYEVCDEVKITATTNAGYTWVGWYKDGEQVSKDLQYVITMTDSDVTYIAKFELAKEMENFVFTSTPKSCEITGVKYSTVTGLTIPEWVTSIGRSAFSGCRKLATVTFEDGCLLDSISAFYGLKGLQSLNNIPAGVTSIDSKAFSGCSNLATVNFADGSLLETIQSYAFQDCSRLKEINIPASVTSIGSRAFSGCSKLVTVTFADGSLLETIGSSAFNGCSSLNKVNITDIDAWCNIDFGSYDANPLCYAKNLYLNDELVTEAKLDKTTKIGSYAFYRYDKLTKITISASVTSIGSSAFSSCSNLTTVTFAGGSLLETIGSSAFSGCSNLTTVTFAGGSLLETIGSSAFYNCSGLQEITIPANVTSIGSSAFSGCSNLTTVTFAGGSLLETIGSSAFNGCSSLQEITIPANVTSIDGWAFSGCSNLAVTFADGCQLDTISAFYGLKGLQSLNNIPANVTTIGNSAFEDCSNLTTVTFVDGSLLETIGDSAFYNCSSLQEITIPTNVTYIGNAFANCTNLATVNWNATNCTSVGSSMFNGCTNLTTVNIGANVTSIPSYAFYNCSGLQEITIPASVTSIGSSAFSGCSNLTTVTFAGGSLLETIGSSAFNGCSSLQEITIPANVTSIGSSPFEECSCLNKVNITDIDAWCNIDFGNYDANPLYYAKNLYLNDELVTEANLEKATKIGSYAFYRYDKLTKITIPANVTSIGEDAFEYCSNLTTVIFAKGSLLQTIGKYAFYKCSGLQEINIPASVTSIGISAFYGCSCLNKVNIADIDAWCNIDFGSYDANPLCYAKNLYLNDELVTEAKLDKTTKIGSYAFYRYDKLTKITISANVTTIDSSAFYGCSNLTTVTFADGSLLETIGSNAFYNCSSLQEITIPANVTSIGNYAFNNCYRLKTVYYGGSQTQWGSITIESNNSYLKNATRYYYSADKPSSNYGSYWHYVNGVPTIWKEED